MKRFILLALLAAPAQAHDWYPAICCSDKDCYELPADAVEITPEGYRIKTNGDLIPYDRARVTPPEGGGAWHICTYDGEITGQTIGRTYQSGACFWAPLSGL